MPNLTVSLVPNKDTKLSNVIFELERLHSATVQTVEWEDFPADEDGVFDENW